MSSNCTENETASHLPDCRIKPIRGIGELRMYRGIVQPFDAHAHDYYVIGLVKEGCRTLQCNKQTFSLCPGNMVVFNPGDVHSCKHDDTGTFAYDCITVAPSFLDNARLAGPKVTSREAVMAFRETVLAIDFGNDVLISKRLLSLSGLLLSSECTNDRACVNSEAATRAMAHFCENLSKPSTLEELACREGISAYALIRAYRNRFCITPMKHLASLRVEYAAKLLARGVEPSTVASEVGFTDQPHLTRAFKRCMGVAPAAYQRMVTQTKAAL